jgi:hypothetical protein
VKTFDDLVQKPHHCGDGISARMNFPNGYGVSVVRFRGHGEFARYASYTDDENEWEVAVIHNEHLCYETPITNDVIGHLTKDEVTDVMRRIQELPPKSEQPSTRLGNPAPRRLG